MDAIIMAGGKGERCLPFTKYINKCAIEILDKPTIAWTVEGLRKHGIDNVFVVVNSNRESIENSLKEFENIIFVQQKETKGTGNALASIDWDLVSNEFIILAGDTLYDMNIIKILIQNCNMMVIGKVEDNSEYGVVEYSDGVVKKIHEKKGEEGDVNVSAYHFDKTILQYFGSDSFVEVINKAVSNGLKVNVIPIYDFSHLSSKDDVTAILGVKCEEIGDVHRFTVAVGKKTIGSVNLVEILNYSSLKRYGIVEDLVVDNDFRRIGIATMLMNSLVNVADRIGLYWIIANSRFERKHVHSFYESLGFEKYGYEFKMLNKRG